MLWKEMIQEEREEAKEEGRAEGREEGRAEGRAEGRIETYRELILEKISEFMEYIPDELKQRVLRENDLNVLKDYFRKANQFATIDEFLK